MKNLFTSRRGFSIIELLVVIVVISILAATVTVAYRAMVKNSENAKYVTYANQWIKTFETYGARNGYAVVLPGTTESSCLGKSSDYPALDATFTTGTCSSTGVVNNNALYTELSKLGVPNSGAWKSPVETGQGNDKQRGLLYTYATVKTDTQPYPYIAYALKGDADCGAKPTHRDYTSATDSTYCWIRIKTWIGPTAIAPEPPVAPVEPEEPVEPPSEPTMTPEEALLEAQLYQPPKDEQCLTVITQAQHTETGVIYNFTTSCIPDGWVAIGGGGGGAT